MRALFLILSSVFTFITAFCQDTISLGKIEYIRETNLGQSIKRMDGLTTLYFNKSSSIFIHNDAPQKDEFEEIGMRINKIHGDKDGFPIYIDNTKQKFYNKNSKDVIIIDTLINPQWNIIQDTLKKIGDYNCLLAKGVSYGRNYYAWFTPSLPINAGPYKLRGLPGLILETSSEDGKVKFTFKKLDTSKESGTYISVPTAEYIYHGREEYQKKQKEKFDKWKKYINSQDNGTTINSKKSTTKKDITIEKW